MFGQDEYPDCPVCNDNSHVEFVRWINGGGAAEFECHECGEEFDTATAEMNFG